MLNHFAVLNSEQVVERPGLATPLTFTDGEDKIAFTQYLVNLLVLEGLVISKAFLPLRWGLLVQ
jgi:hypothetical protein